MAQNLKEYLDEHRCQGFRPVPHYFPEGDFISYYLRDIRCHAQQVDDLLTVYLAIGTDELIGCKIKGVKHVLEKAAPFGLAFDDVRLGFLLFVGAVRAKDEGQKRRYEEAAVLVRDVKLGREELQTVAK